MRVRLARNWQAVCGIRSKQRAKRPLAGQFIPGPDAKPAIGEPGKAEFVVEDRVEFVVKDRGDRTTVKSVVAELKKVFVWRFQTMRVTLSFHTIYRSIPMRKRW